ncbi:ATP-binding protein [Streptomyces humi]
MNAHPSSASSFADGTRDAPPAALWLPSSGADSDSGRWALPHHGAAAQTARGLVARTVAEWPLACGTVQDILLVVSELVTNAVRHAEPPIFLGIRRTGKGRVCVETTDGGERGGLRRAETSGDPDEHGRGLVIVDCLSVAHGCRIAEQGTTWWAEFAEDR